MKVYTYSQARQQLASVLDEARREGEVRIRRRDGQLFVIQPATQSRRSPLDVPGIKVRATTADIVAAVRDSRSITTRLPARAKPNKRMQPTASSGANRSRRGRKGGG